MTGVHDTHKGDAYQRIGDESRRLSFHQRLELEWDRGATTFDGTSAPTPSRTALDQAQVEAYRERLGSSSGDLALGARDLLTDDGQVTVAGHLLFSARPQTAFPNAHVRVLRYGADDRGVGRGQTLIDGADVRCEGSLPEQITHAHAVIEELIPRRRSLADSGTFCGIPIIPRDAWLEGLVNAVVHRSYSMAGDHVRVEIFPGRIEITSPGRFPGIADPTDPTTISRHARNPRIARVCSDLGIAQELGEGIRRIFHEMRQMGLVDPLYVQTNDAVRLTLAAQNAVPMEVRSTVGPGAMRVLEAMRLAQRPIGTGQVAELVDCARPTALRHVNKLKDARLVTWEGESAKDPRATWRLT